MKCSVSVPYVCNGCTHLKQKIIYRYIIGFMQVKFKFGNGALIFDRVVLLEEIFSFHSLSFVWMYI
jgi:hypothetical protein